MENGTSHPIALFELCGVDCAFLYGVFQNSGVLDIHRNTTGLAIEGPLKDTLKSDNREITVGVQRSGYDQGPMLLGSES